MAACMDKQDDVLVDVQHLTKSFVADTNFFGHPTSYVQAVDDVSFQIRRGEAFGLVGESGCGKTTIGKMLVGLLAPTSGRILFEGRDITAMPARERRGLCRDIQLVFQDPYASLNPRQTVGAIVAEPIITNGLLPREQVDARVDELFELVGLAPYMKGRYPHEFSGGQRQRVGIARALAVNPKLIVCDEPVSALDVSIQAQVLNLLDDLKEQLGLTYLFIAHGLNVVKHISDRVGVMYLGRLMEIAPKASLVSGPVVPYTQALLSAIPPQTRACSASASSWRGTCRVPLTRRSVAALRAGVLPRWAPAMWPHPSYANACRAMHAPAIGTITSLARNHEARACHPVRCRAPELRSWRGGCERRPGRRTVLAHPNVCTSAGCASRMGGSGVAGRCDCGALVLRARVFRCRLGVCVPQGAFPLPPRRSRPMPFGVCLPGPKAALRAADCGTAKFGERFLLCAVHSNHMNKRSLHSDLPACFQTK